MEIAEETIYFVVDIGQELHSTRKVHRNLFGSPYTMSVNKFCEVRSKKQVDAQKIMYSILKMKVENMVLHWRREL